jgi:hypothetical protein
MKRRVPVAAAAALGALLVWAALGFGASLPHAERECAGVAVPYREHGRKQHIGISEIRTEEVGCTEARDLGRDYARRSYFRRRGSGGAVANKWPGSVGNFGCLSERLGSDIRAVVCREGSRAISFAWYDSSPYH